MSKDIENLDVKSGNAIFEKKLLGIAMISYSQIIFGVILVTTHSHLLDFLYTWEYLKKPS